MIRNVLLDLDDTLLDFHRAERVALSGTLRDLGVEPREETLRRYSQLNQEQWRLLERGELTREEVMVRRYRLLFEELGVACDPRKAADDYENRLCVGHYFVDGAEELLRELDGLYRLYLVSNGTTRVQESRIRSAGIGGYFQGIFLSQQVGRDKPDPSFFQRCFAAIPDFRREETVIVGDSLTSDIQGGKNAGIATVWFCREGAEMMPAITPDRTIRRLQELPALLEKM